jgi:hypothetical protein
VKYASSFLMSIVPFGRAARACRIREVCLAAILIAECLPGAQAQEILLNGAAVAEDGRLRLTASARNQRGAAWLDTKQLVRSGFATRFRFRISNPGGPGARDSTGAMGADGVAFVIQNASRSALGNSGAGMGYDGIRNCLAIEFDTWKNDDVGDPNANHIAVQFATPFPGGTIARATSIPDLSDGAIHTAAILYLPEKPSGAGQIQVFLDGVRVLTTELDLASLVRLDTGRAWVGFTGATGGAWQTQEILDWIFLSLG